MSAEADKKLRFNNLLHHVSVELPLGIATLEDKIVQASVRTVLQAIYETDFLGFSYGFRPGRGCHQALDALSKSRMR